MRTFNAQGLDVPATAVVRRVASATGRRRARGATRLPTQFLLLAALLVPACLDHNDGNQSDGAPLSRDETIEPDTAPQPDTATTPELEVIITPEPDTAIAPDVPVTPDTTECLALTGECMRDEQCCSGICAYLGPYALTNPCIEPLAVGQECARDTWCESGHCVNGHCASGPCLPESAQCDGEPWRCCGATFCSWRPDTYAPGLCTPLLQAGASCWDNTQCVTQLCDEGVCR